MDGANLTTQELRVLELLGKAWDTFQELPDRDPSRRTQELREFLSGVHRLQDMVALRVARRLDPEVWK